MKTIILFTNMSSIKKHWQKAIAEVYQEKSIEDFQMLISYLDNHTTPVIVLFDEMSVVDIHKSLQILKKYKFASILLFNALPEVHHASTLLGDGIRGYENSYLHKDNLLKMIESVRNGHNWLFSDLTHYIINKYIQ